MRYIVIAQPGGYAVAYAHVSQGLVSVVECATRPAAAAEAARLNAQHEERIKVGSLAAHREHAITARRPARWFEPDAFA